MCEEHPFLGASLDVYLHDPQSNDQYCPRSSVPINIETVLRLMPLESDFCSKVVPKQDSCFSIELKRRLSYYAQVHG